MKGNQWIEALAKLKKENEELKKQLKTAQANWKKCLEHYEGRAA